jgi:glycerol-3-phosphate acyltransferase PlsX
VLLDTGANVACRPRHLVQYAVMGACYAREILGRHRVRVGVLANGTEAHQGTELTRLADRSLREGSLAFEYVGYVEGRDLFAGDIDVVVCDGFSGNLVLKVSEGAAETIGAFMKAELKRTLLGRALALPLLPVLRRLRRRIDYAERGGGPLLGVRRTAIICHGGSNPKALMNGILAGARHADRGLDEALARWLREHQALCNRSRELDEQGGTGSGEGQRDDDQSEDSRRGPGGLRAGAQQLRPRAHGGYQRRVDHRAHGDQGATHPRGGALHL